MSAPSTSHNRSALPGLGSVIRWLAKPSKTEGRAASAELSYEAHAARVDLLNAQGFERRHAAVREALAAGLNLHEIEATLDWADLRRTAALNT